MPHLSNFENLSKCIPHLDKRIAEVLILAEESAYENNLQSFTNIRQVFELIKEGRRKIDNPVENKNIKKYYIDLCNEIGLLDKYFDDSKRIGNNALTIAFICVSKGADETFCKKIVTIERIASSALIHRDLETGETLDYEGFTQKLRKIKVFAAKNETTINIDEFEHLRVIYDMIKLLYASNVKDNFQIKYIPICGWRYESDWKSQADDKAKSAGNSYVEHNIIRRGYYSRFRNGNNNEYSIINVYNKASNLNSSVKREYDAYYEINKAVFERTVLEYSYFEPLYSKYYITVQKSPLPLKLLSHKIARNLSDDERYSILKRLGDNICVLNDNGIYIRTLTYKSIYLVDMGRDGKHKYYPLITGLSGVKLGSSYATVGSYLKLYFHNTFMCAPEIKALPNYDNIDWEKVDAFSFGLLALHIFHSNVFSNITDENAINKALKEEHNQVLRAGIEKLINRDPQKRGTIKDFFDNIG